MFEDFEFNPMVAAFAVVGAIISLVVMSRVEVALFYRVVGFIASGVVTYIVVDIIMNR